MKFTKNFNFLILLISICFFSITRSGASDIVYIENKTRISPKQNVFDKSNLRDLHFLVHHPVLK